MTVTFHGVRGSTPCHGPDIVRYGGNTSCVSLAVPGHDPVLFDLGTGLRYFGSSCPRAEAFRGTCLVSHLHWDHIQGLPFFKPSLFEAAHVVIYGPEQPDGGSVAGVFADTIKPPLFPIDLASFPGTFEFHDVGDDEFTIGEIDVVSRVIPHVGPTVGYRVTWNGRSIAYLSDHQMPGDGSYTVPPGVYDLCRDVDLLIHDAQYSREEFERKSTWGHCTPDFAVWLAASAGAKRLAFFHHDPAHDDDDLDEMLSVSIECAERLGIDAFAAREQLSITV